MSTSNVSLHKWNKTKKQKQNWKDCFFADNAKWSIEFYNKQEEAKCKT